MIEMKTLQKNLLLLGCLILAAMSFNSCEFNHIPDPEHPTFVSYTISATNDGFNGPDQLLADIHAWIKDNQLVYDIEVGYSTGEKSEFTKPDNEAIIKYEQFVSKFRAYLSDQKAKLAAGKYGNITHPISATFNVFAKRFQGQEGTLKYEQIDFHYPDISN
jgi:hypothetical protein